MIIHFLISQFNANPLNALLVLATFLMVIATFILAILTYYNSKLLRLLKAESIHFPDVRESVKNLIYRLNNINEVVMNPSSQNYWDGLLKQDNSIDDFYGLHIGNKEENLLISDLLQFHMGCRRKKQICNSLASLNNLFKTYNEINNETIKEIKEIINRESKKNISYITNNINVCNSYYVEFIVRSWSGENFPKTAFVEQNTTKYMLRYNYGACTDLCSVESKDDAEKLQIIFEKLITDFKELDEYKNYNEKIQENRKDFQKQYVIVKNILEKMQFHVRFTGKCEFLGGRKELKNIIIKDDGINCK